MKRSLFSAGMMAPAVGVILAGLPPPQAVPAAPVHLEISSPSSADTLFSAGMTPSRVREVKEAVPGQVTRRNS